MSNTLISEPEKTFIIHGIQDNYRADGRECLHYRQIELETDVVSNCNGSAHVRLANTDILVGVKAELDSPEPSKPNHGRLEFFVDCSANANPEFEGRGGEEIATEIRQLLSRAYSNPGCVDLESLAVIPGVQVWILYVDIVILECGGSLVDACSMAVKAALFDTKVPNVTFAMGEDGSREIEVSDDPYDARRLDVARIPCLISLSRIGQKFAVDCGPAEEACGLAKLVVAVTENGEVTLVRKTGSGSLHWESVAAIFQAGADIGRELNKLLVKKLELESGLKKDRVGFLK